MEAALGATPGDLPGRQGGAAGLFRLQPCSLGIAGSCSPSKAGLRIEGPHRAAGHGIQMFFVLIALRRPAGGTATQPGQRSPVRARASGGQGAAAAGREGRGPGSGCGPWAADRGADAGGLATLTKWKRGLLRGRLRDGLRRGCGGPAGPAWTGRGGARPRCRPMRRDVPGAVYVARADGHRGVHFRGLLPAGGFSTPPTGGEATTGSGQAHTPSPFWQTWTNPTAAAMWN